MLVETSLAVLATGKQVQLVPGDTLRVFYSLNYLVAQAKAVTVWGALGIGLGRDIESFTPINLPAALTQNTWNSYIDIPIPTFGKTNGTYWLQVEVQGYDLGKTAGQKIEGAVVISGMGAAPSDYVLIRDTKYPLASTYYGYAERSTETFDVIIPSFMLSSDKVDQMVASFEDEFAKKGIHMLELKLYEKSGLIQTSYIAIITTTLPAAASGLSVVPLIFGIDDVTFWFVVAAVILILGLGIILYNTVRKDVSQFLFGTPTTPGIMSWIEPLIMIMVLSMMMEMMGPMMAPEGAPPQPKPVTEAVVKGAKEVGKGIVSGGRYIIEKIKERG